MGIVSLVGMCVCVLACLDIVDREPVCQRLSEEAPATASPDQMFMDMYDINPRTTRACVVACDAKSPVGERRVAPDECRVPEGREGRHCPLHMAGVCADGVYAICHPARSGQLMKLCVCVSTGRE